MGVTARLRALALAAIFTAIPLGQARAADDPAANEAKRHYEEGTKAFNLGEYPRAIAEFKATYNAKPDPLLLYNIAQSYRLAGDPAQALFFYKSFLRNMPGASNRKEVEGRIKTLEKQVADHKRDPSSAPPPVIVPTLPSSSAAMPAPAGATAPAPPSELGAPPAEPVAEAVPAPRADNAMTPSPPPQAAAAPPATMPPPGAPGVDLTTPSRPPDEPSRPIYKRWWFWAGAAGAVIIVGALAAANAKKGPNTQLGTFDPSFRP